MDRIVVQGSRFSKRLFGTNLTRQALSCSQEDTVWLARLIGRIGMNVVRFSSQDEAVIQARWQWMLHHFRENGVYWAVPVRSVHSKGDVERFTSQARINAEKRQIDRLFGTVNPYTRMTLGEDNALAFVEIANEASVWRELFPGRQAWNAMNTVARRKLVDTVRSIEDDYMGQLSEHLRQHTSAIRIGSQTGYETQEATLDAQDIHLYINRPDTGRLPARFDNRKVLDDKALWPCVKAYDRHPDKPVGCSEFNDAGPSWFYGSNLLAFGALAALQDWSFLLHHHMGNAAIVEKDRIPGNLLDAAHAGKLRVLELIRKMFLDREVDPVAPVGFSSPDYRKDVVDHGEITGLDILRRKGGLDFWRPLRGSGQVKAERGKGLRIRTQSLDVTAYNSVSGYAGKSGTFGRCENVDMIWDDPVNDVNNPPKHYSSWGKGPVWLEMS